MRSGLRAEQPTRITSAPPSCAPAVLYVYIFVLAIAEGGDVLQLRPRGFHPVFGGAVKPIGLLLQLRQPGRPRLGVAAPDGDAGRNFDVFGRSAHGGVSAGGFVYSLFGGRGYTHEELNIQSKRD